MTDRTTVHGLQVATNLHRFIEDQVLPGTGIDAATFWKGFDAIVSDLAPRNIALLAERDRLQTELDTWHKANPGPIKDMVAYRGFLEKIGYLVPQPADVKVTTANVDDELATQAGPQLVVPILNARYALNAANARWGSLYDALYGTDAISEEGGAEKGKGYNPVRGAKVIAFARQVLDDNAPLASGSHKDATGYRVEYGGKSMCYVTDTEHVPGKPDQNILGLIEGADLVIYDSTYTDREFESHVGWGHSTWQEGVRLCLAAQVKQLAIFHHDPDHEDPFMERLEADARQMWSGALVARENMRVNLL